jgi:hypothetical protein
MEQRTLDKSGNLINWHFGLAVHEKDQEPFGKSVHFYDFGLDPERKKWGLSIVVT